MKFLKFWLRAGLVATAIAGCSACTDGQQPDVHNTTSTELARAIYHWKTAFELDSAEVAFLRHHDVGRIYLRMFDVATERDFLNGGVEVVPVATTSFKDSVPKGIEVVPTTYITLDALRAMKGREEAFGGVIADRLCAMATVNHCGKINEVQLDCDWTRTTRSSYFKLCQAVSDTLKGRGISLSVTIRLHQLGEAAPPAQRGVLMVYNTGELKHPETQNSILHTADIAPYLKRRKYPLPLDYAYPTFGWGVRFRYGAFAGITSEEATPTTKGEHIRRERPSSEIILEAKQMVEEALGAPSRGNILYHLDQEQLQHYSDHEIAEIYRH